MSVTLEPDSLAASARRLRSAFAEAQFDGMKATTVRGAVHVEAPLARLDDYHFVYSGDHCSWTTPKAKVVLHLGDTDVEQHARNKNMLLVFRRRLTSVKAAATGGKASPIREVFYQRSLRAIEELKSLDERQLAQAAQAPTDYSVLLSALNTDEALASIRANDPLAGARLRGLEAKRRLLEAEGGALPSAQAASLLQISRQAVDKRRAEGKLLALELGKKGYHYPVWQFGLKGLEKVLSALKDRDPWERLSFFLNPSAALGDATPLEVLQKGDARIADLVAAAAAYGEQGE